MKDIHGKSTLVQISARFELVRVGVIGSQCIFIRKWELIQDLQHKENNLPEIRLIPPNYGLID